MDHEYIANAPPCRLKFGKVVQPLTLPRSPVLTRLAADAASKLNRQSSASSADQRDPLLRQFNEMEHQRCYIYEPSETEQRPSKRQRTNGSSPHVQLSERLATYRDIWAEQEQHIEVS